MQKNKKQPQPIGQSRVLKVPVLRVFSSVLFPVVVAAGAAGRFLLPPAALAGARQF